MANILKEAKRGNDLPRVLDGHVHTCERYERYVTGDDVERGTMPPLLYCLNIGKAGKDGIVGYMAQLSEDEMIKVTSEWLEMLNRRRIDAKRKQNAKS